MKDAPWAYSGSPMISIKRGERLKESDPQHRTKGAKSKPFINSDKPAGFDKPNGLDIPRKRGASYQRRQARRAALRNAYLNGK